jgi:sporulation protein YlmC with PRC-barrel domain
MEGHEQMKFSELKGRAVVSLEDARKVGEVEDILLDPHSRRTSGIKVKTGLFSPPVVVPVEQVKGVGPDAITFTPRVEREQGVKVERVEAEASAQAHVQPANAERPAPQAPDADEAAGRSISLTGMLGDKVLTDTGTLLGEVQDVLIDPATLAVTGLVVGTGGLFARSRDIPLSSEVRYGDKLITVPAPLSESPDSNTT